MTQQNAQTTARETVAPRLPWLVIVNPDWYDEDEGDAGFAWSGEAADREHAINQALAECWAANDREDDDGEPEAPPTYQPAEHMQDGFTVYQAAPDFHALAQLASSARLSADPAAIASALDLIDYALSVTRVA